MSLFLLGLQTQYFVQDSRSLISRFHFFGRKRIWNRWWTVAVFGVVVLSHSLNTEATRLSRTLQKVQKDHVSCSEPTSAKLVSCISSFSAVRDKSGFLWEIPSLACLCHRPQSAGGAASPCSGEKPALVGCAVEKVHVSIACFLTSEGFIVTSESMGSFSHSLEQYSSKVRKSFYSTALDKVGFFRCDTATAGLPQAVQRACRWVPDSPACFCCALND